MVLSPETVAKIQMVSSPLKKDKKAAASDSRYSDLELLFGSEKLLKMKSTNVLVVGAGGIGCELLKNLVMSGFENIQIIDLDTIDLSNLNRQFLFQKQHIKKPKAVIARESVLKFNPNANIVAHHATIFDSQFDLSWFKSFHLVLNALDNLAARRYVNKICLAANIPLIESGTAGYLGQVSVHKKGQIACYDCTPKEKERKSYPVCTIRSTPSEPIHCIVWAKSYLFSNLFGKAEEEEEEENISQEDNSDNADEIKNLRKQATELKLMRESIGKKDAGKRIFEKVFKTDIERLLEMEDLWKIRTKPTPLNMEILKKKVTLDRSCLDHAQKPWTLEENIHIFLESIDKLGERLLDLKKQDPLSHLEFDKDDETVLEFVAATANLRAQIYHIPLSSRFVIKQMAGNIIPAIATTNAIIAGMIVMIAVKIVLGKLNECKYTYLTYGGDRTHFLLNEATPKPNPQCQVCTNAYLTLTISPSTTLEQLIQYLSNKGNRPCLEGELTFQVGERLIYDVEFEDHLKKKLVDVGIENGAHLLVTNDHESDESLSHSVVFFVAVDDTAKKSKIEIGGDLEAPLPTRPSPISSENAANESASVPSSSKRKLEDSPLDRSPNSKKKNKIKVIEVDEDGVKPIDLD